MIVKEMSNKQDLKKLLKKRVKICWIRKKYFLVLSSYVAAYLFIIKY